jgi:hypothetical protein
VSALRRARSPDGREWEVNVHRVRLPKWHQSDYDPWESDDYLIGFLEAIVLAPLLWFVLPLLRMLAELPVAVARSFFSSTRWVEARCRTPGEIRIVWRTSRLRAEELADEIAQRLGEGYGDLTFAGAKRVEMTEPPGLGDLES